MSSEKPCGCRMCQYENTLSNRTIRKHLRKYGMPIETNAGLELEVTECQDCETESEIIAHREENITPACAVTNNDEDITSTENRNDLFSSEETVSTETIMDDRYECEGEVSDYSDSSTDTDDLDLPHNYSESEDDSTGNVKAKCTWSCDYDMTAYESGIAIQNVGSTNITVLQWLALNFHLFVSHPSMSKSAFTHNLALQKVLHDHNVGNMLPSSYYEARKLIDPFVIKKKVFHVCVNDCIIFRDSEKYSYMESSKCPVCEEERYVNREARVPVARRRFIYIPVGPRIARTFGDVNLAQLVQSHPGSIDTDQKMWDIHHSPVWRELYSTNGYFNGDRAGLSYAIELDGVNPFHNMGVIYSMTPIMLTLLNLPRHVRNLFGNINLVGIIPGSGNSEAKNLDPYVEILVDELLFLSGCTAYNAYKKAPIVVKVKLLLFVLDYPGLSKLFHQHGSGSLSGCHWCQVRGMKCSHLNKVIYLSNRSFLDRNDSIRQDTTHFIDKRGDFSSRPKLRVHENELSYREAFEKAKNKSQSSLVATATGCKSSYPLSHLPGHDRLHSSLPDACHTIKDVIQNIMNLITGNKKIDLHKVINSERKFGRLENLSLNDGDFETVEPISEPVCKKQKLNQNMKKNPFLKTLNLPYVLTKDELKIANSRAESIRVPVAFGLKPSGFVINSGSLKSHDWKQIATQGILKFCLKGTLSKECRDSLFLLLDSIAELCQECVSNNDVNDMNIKLNRALALLERDFPLTLQNITTHILHHIPDGIAKYGPVYGTWMYVYERFNSWITKRVLNMRYPEATVVETFLIHDWCNFMISAGRIPSHALDGSSIDISNTFDDSHFEEMDLKRYPCVLKKRQINSIHKQCNDQCDTCLIYKYYVHKEIDPQTKRIRTYTAEPKELVTAKTMSSFVSAEFSRGSQEQKLLSGKFLFFGRIIYFIQHVNGKSRDMNTFAYVQWFDNIQVDLDSGLWYTSMHTSNNAGGKGSFLLTKYLSDPLVTAIDNNCLWFISNSPGLSNFSYKHTDRGI